MLQTLGNYLRDNPWAYRALVSLAAAAGLLLLRWFLLKGVARMPISSHELRRRWILTVRNLTLLLLAVVLFLIWSEQLRTESVDAPSVEPRVTFALPAPNRTDLIVRVAVPVQRKGHIQQQIIRTYLHALATMPPRPDPEPDA